jgi:hypothetical protein
MSPVDSALTLPRRRPPPLAAISARLALKTAPGWPHRARAAHLLLNSIDNSIHVSRKFTLIAPAASNLAFSGRTPETQIKEEDKRRVACRRGGATQGVGGLGGLADLAILVPLLAEGGVARGGPDCRALARVAVLIGLGGVLREVEPGAEPGRNRSSQPGGSSA